MTDWITQVLEERADIGRHFLLRVPESSSMWLQTSLSGLAERSDVLAFVVKVSPIPGGHSREMGQKFVTPTPRAPYRGSCVAKVWLHPGWVIAREGGDPRH